MNQPPGPFYHSSQEINYGNFPPTPSIGYPPGMTYQEGGIHNGSSRLNYDPSAKPQTLQHPSSVNGYENKVPNGPLYQNNDVPLMSHVSKMPPGPHASSQVPPQSISNVPISQPALSGQTSHRPFVGLQHPQNSQPPISLAGGDPRKMQTIGPPRMQTIPPMHQMQGMQINDIQPGVPMSNSISGPVQPLPNSLPLDHMAMSGEYSTISSSGHAMMGHFLQQALPTPGPPMSSQQSALSRGPPMTGQSPMVSQRPPVAGQPPPPSNLSGQAHSHVQDHPPVQGYQPLSSMGAPGQQFPQHQQPQRRLDPDAMPSPIQVIEADMARSEEPFRTDGRGLVPPLVTSKFLVEDAGSVSPRYIRCSTYNLPATADMAKGCQVPMALSIKPLANLPDGEAPPLIVDPGPEGPLRCKRCKAYMCPQFKFTDGGRRFQCVLCNAISDTPHYYFDHIDHMGQRVDKFRRPELCRGSYEVVATKDYCKNDEFPNPPAFIFAIDVSYNAMKCGMVDLLCKEIGNLLDRLPCDVGCERSSIRVAFFTYNNTLHFYNLKSTLAQPQMLVVSDVSDVFVPLQDGFLVSVEESSNFNKYLKDKTRKEETVGTFYRHVISSLLDQIPEMFADTRETEVVFAPVIQAAVQAFKYANCSGKLFMFNTTMPTGEYPGKLKNRDDRKQIGTDKEKNLFSPAGNFYPNLAKDCVVQGCCVDLFLFPNQFMDVATLGQVAQLTGGHIYKYNFFRPEVDGIRFINDLAHDIRRNIVFDAIMRVRSSTGIRAVNFAGALYMSNTTDVELAGFDSDQAVCVELKHDDKINEEYGAYVQVALLYTSVNGQRRLRVHNLNLAVCTQLTDLYRSCETDVLINYFAKAAIIAGLSQAGSKIREEMLARVATILATYRKHCASPSSPGQLILPECMKLLPVYLNCLLKNDAVHSSHEISTDDRAYLRQLVLSMDVAQTQVFFYPRLLPVRGFSSPNLPKAVRCSEDRLSDSEAYLLDNGLNLFLWVGNSVDPGWIRSVFGVQSAAQIDIDQGTLTTFDNPDSQQLRSLIAIIQSQRTRTMKLTIIRQRDKLEPWFKHFLVEDRGLGGGASYVDFLCHVHKEIRAILA